MHSFATFFGAKWKYFAIFRILLLLRKWESQKKIQRKRQRVRQTGQKKLLHQNEIKGVCLCVSEAVYVYASALYYNSIGEIFFFVFISFTLTSHFFRFGERSRILTVVYGGVFIRQIHTHTRSHTYACNWSGELHKICKSVWSMCMWRLRLLLNKRTTHQHVYRACQTKNFLNAKCFLPLKRLAYQLVPGK